MRLNSVKKLCVSAIGVFVLASVVQAREVKDLTGTVVNVPDHPKRVVLGEGRFIFSMALLDRANPVERLVGWQGELAKQDPFSWKMLTTKFPQIKNVPFIGTTTEASVSPEKIMALKPDLAIFSETGHGPGEDNPMIPVLRAAGVPVVFVDFRQQPIQHTVESIRIMGEALGREKEANEYIKFYQEHLNKVKALVDQVPENKRPKVFIEMLAGVYPTCCHSTGNGNFGSMIETAGGINIAKGVVPAAIGDTSLEFLLKSQPDIYMTSGSRSSADRPGLLVGPGADAATAVSSLNTLVARPGIRDLNAVKDHRYFGIWHAFYDSPLNIVAIEAFTSWFYPEQAKEAHIDPAATMKEIAAHYQTLPTDGAYWTAADKK